MIAQKEIFIPTVDTIPVVAYDASADFTTDYIEFPNSMKDWSLQVIFIGATISASCALTIESSNDSINWTKYSPSTTDMDMNDEYNYLVYDSIMPARYMRLVYNADTTTGDVSLIICK